MNLFFDNASGVRPSERALELYVSASREHFANQEAGGSAGTASARFVREASLRLVSSGLAPGADVFWTNTGTDALELAVHSFCMQHPGKRVLTTPAEHPALRNALFRAAGKWNINLTEVRLCPDGAVDLRAFEEQLSPDVVLVAIHHVNAETGRIQDLPRLRKTMDMLGSRAAFLADTTQSVGKIPIPWTEARLDYISLSGCKIGSPGGAALIYRDSPDRKRSRGIRSVRGEEHAVGRCLPAAAHTISMLMEEHQANLAPRMDRIRSLKHLLLDEIKRISGGRVMESIPFEQASPYILHVIFPDWQGAILVRSLESLGVSTASGSACMSETPLPSQTLSAMGIPKKLAFGAFRLSLWDDSDEEGIKHFAKLFESVLKNY